MRVVFRWSRAVALLRSRGIGLRLAGGFALVLALLLGVTSLALLQLQRMQSQADELVSQHIRLMSALGNLQETGAERSLLLRDLVLTEDASARAEAGRKLQANAEVHSSLANALADLADSSVISGARAAAQGIVEQAERTSAIEKAVQDRIADARYDEARVLLAASLTPQQLAMNRLLRESFTATAREAGGSVETNRRKNQLMLLVIASAGAVAMLFGIVIAWVITRGIVAPVNHAREGALQIASGDLTQALGEGSRDEVGQLVNALEWMREAVGDAVGDIRRAAERVRQGAQQIEEGSRDLSARTEEQAASLEQSASSMEQFTATVQQNAQSAGEASALARETTGVATRGGDAVRGMVQTMRGIHGASERIGDIIGVIDSIAFQTNILALNAAVEAARAGEQGRGFAVVAAEVRSLAQRSAAAAKEIKSLIRESASRVDGGVREVESAGRTMDEIVASVARVSALVSEIAHASSEQLAGIEQVNRAIAQMDGSTQRNAGLVQQAADAAHHMAGQAQVLIDAVVWFKVPGAASDAPAAAAAPQPPVAEHGRLPLSPQPA